jgi:hypothetical protein
MECPQIRFDETARLRHIRKIADKADSITTLHTTGLAPGEC